jgi:hypothetical protein
MHPFLAVGIGAAIGTALVALVQYILHKIKIQKIKKRMGYNHDRFDRK